jgi:hypothetical protein
MIGSTVQCNFGGPEKGEGILLKVGLDYCVLQCNKEVYYYPLHHIKGYTLIQKDDNSEENSNTEDNGNENNDNNKNLKYPIVVPGRRFVDVIDRLKGQKVQFNKGPSKIKGTVVGRDTKHIILEINDEVLYVSKFHIQNMCWDYCNSNNNQQSHDDSKDDKNNDNNENSSSTNNQENNNQENNDQEDNDQENNNQENNDQENNNQENNDQENNDQEDNDQENNNQEDNDQENNNQEDNDQENNSQRENNMDQWWRWYDSLWEKHLRKQLDNN